MIPETQAMMAAPPETPVAMHPATAKPISAIHQAQSPLAVIELREILKWL